METTRYIIGVLLRIVIVNRNLSRSGSTEIPGIKIRSTPPIIAREGDLNIGLVMSMSTYNATTKQCTSDPLPSGCQWLEMAIYVVDKINRRSDLLPNITLGFVSVDGCNNDMRALEVTTYLTTDDSCSSFQNHTHDQTSIPFSNNTLSNELKHYGVIGLVGISSSRVAVVVSPLMGVYQIPVISTYATSDELSDKSRYEYFSRLVAADRYQALAMLGIARYYGWTYISVVYTQGSYGENGIKQIQDLLVNEASSYGVCIAVAIQISSEPDQAEYSAIADTLLFNRKARAVILFVEFSDFLQPLFNEIRKSADAGAFIWLGGDTIALVEQKPVIQDDMLEGAIFMEHSAFAMPDFDDFLKSVTPANTEGNTLVRRLWKHKYQCVFNGNSNSTPSNLCSMNLHLDSSICPVQPAIVDRVHDGFLIIATALHDQISGNCPNGFTEKGILKDCISGSDLLRKIRGTTFKGILGKIQFNANGDFMENLQVKQFYLAEDNIRRSKVIGSWDATDYHLLINETLVNWKPFNKNVTFADKNIPPVSICSRPCRDNQYIVKQSITCCWICGDCRDNEVVFNNQTGCQSCPMFTWPDEATATTCIPIVPVLLHYSDVISVVLLFLAVILSILAAFCLGAFLMKRNNKLVKAHNIQLSMLILLGLVFACVTVVFLVVPADSSPWSCVAGSVGFHLGISMIYTPLLVKNVRIYRIFSFAKKSVRAPRWVSDKSQMAFTIILLTIQVIC